MLCLPVASQRDPAVYRRNRKNPEENAGSARLPIYNTERCQPVTTSTIEVSKIDMQNDNENEQQMTQSDIDEVLARYENILGDHIPESPQKTETVSSKSTIQSKRNKIKSGTANLKPKVRLHRYHKKLKFTQRLISDSGVDQAETRKITIHPHQTKI